MSLLNRIFQRLQDTKEKPGKVDVELKDILFDWFNANNDRIETFDNEFLQPCLEVYKKNEQTKKYIEDYPEQAIERYFNQHAILYLAAKYPDNTRFKILLDFLMDKENQAYAVRDSIRNAPTKHQFQPEKSHLWEILRTGNTIIKIYHAIYDNRDQNISYMSSMPEYLRSLTLVGYEGIFGKVLAYFNQQDFPDKLFALCNSIPKIQQNLSDSSVSILKEEKSMVLEIYNRTNAVTISKELAQDFEDSFFDFPRTKVYNETAFRKRRHLKIEQFPEAMRFIAEYSHQKDSIIKYYLIKMGLSYLPKDLTKMHKGLFSEIQKGLRLSKKSFLAILDSKICSNQSLIYNALLAPILKDEVFEGGLTDELIDQFESKMLEDTVHHRDIIEFQPSFEAIVAYKTTATDELTKSILIAKYNRLYGEVSLDQNWLTINVNNRKQGDIVIGQLLDRLNLLFPSSLKSLAKQIMHISDENKLCTLNIDGVDFDFTINIVVELNEILRTKKTGYRFLPILIQKRESDRNSYNEQNWYKCSIELMCYSQYEFLRNTQYADYSFSGSSFVQNLQYQNYATAMFNFTEKAINLDSEKITFKDDPTWKWFKNDYVDKLESHKKWYPIMDLINQCKGSSKPNKLWAIQINDAIDGFGTERYFRELGSLISASLNESFWFLDKYRVPIKGIIWSCSMNPTSASLSIIKSIVEAAYTKIPGIGPKSTWLGNLGLNALVLSQSDEAFAIMNLTKNKSKYQRFIKALDKSIDKYLENSTGNAEELADKTMPDYGFSNVSKTIEIDESLSVVFLIQNNKLSKKWLLDGKLQTNTPSIIKEKYKAKEKEIISEYKRINSVYKQLKERIKTYWLYDRKWEYSFWHKYIFSHPLLNGYLEKLVWCNETSGYSYIYKNGDFIDRNNQKVVSGSNDIIRLWHPILATSAELSEWQSYLFTNRIEQPIRQIFREHYPFSNKELSNTRSNRFSHHFLLVRKLMAVANSAGWVFTYEHEGESWPRKYLKPLNVTVHLKCDYNRFDYAIPTKEIFFTRGNTANLNSGADIQHKEFLDIPQVTLSEVCRDIDLFIATTSIANDPNLSLKTDQQKSYREDFDKSYFSDNASVKVRKQVLRGLASTLGIDPVFDRNYLLIDGQLNKYRINLGSGFAQLANSQQHINLLPDIKPMNKSRKVHSPIQDDDTLYIILAKAKFLANDSSITDVNFIDATSGDSKV